YLLPANNNSPNRNSDNKLKILSTRSMHNKPSQHISSYTFNSSSNSNNGSNFTNNTHRITHNSINSSTTSSSRYKTNNNKHHNSKCQRKYHLHHFCSILYKGNPSLAPEPLSASPIQPFAPNPTSTMLSFKDPKALEDYKHRQFILEHQRLQQRQELELEAMKEGKESNADQESLGSQVNTATTLRDTLQQESDRSLNLGDTTAMAMAASTGTAGRLTGHVAIATALVPSSTPLSPSAIKEV
ncbi:hypothetical protein BGZ95_007899, partial [Linnemannia exigua]